MSRLTSLSLVVATLAAAPTLHAQAAPQAPADFRVLTVSSFRVPLGEDRGKVMDFMEKWMVPPTKVNPNVLSYRIGQHWYGANSSDVVIVAEYPNWASMTAPCQPCQEWNRANMPAQGTPERQAFSEAQALFLKYYSTHADQIFQVPNSMAKP